MLRIPRFIVTDDSYVDVSEHKSSVASAIASSSLSQSSSEVAMYVAAFLLFKLLWAIAKTSSGGGAYGYSLGVSGGHEYETSERSQQRNQTETNHMVVTYNVGVQPGFPF